MSILNFCTRLQADSYVRSYGEVGFICNVDTQRQEVFDASGAVFLKQLSRAFRVGEAVVDELCRIFPKASREILREDLSDFIRYLHQAGFVEVEGIVNWPFEQSNAHENGTRKAPAKDQNSAEISKFLKEYFAIHPTVFSFQFYTTESCNEHCVHCYVDQRVGGKSLPLERRLALIDQLGSMGTLDITFTGGEALLSSDLPALIDRAKKNDLVISVLSNLTLLTDELFDVIKNANVAIVQTSIYSMDASIHDAITRRQGSLSQTLSAVERLRSAGVRVSISCPIMKENRDLFHKVLRYGADNDIPTNCDFGIMAKENGDTSNLVHRVDTVDLENVVTSVVRDSPKYREMLERNANRLDDVSIDTCGIGNYMLCLKSTGEFLPCPGFGLVVGNAWESDIEDVWRSSPQLIALRQFSRSATFPQCTSCEATTFCNFCLAKFHNEADWTAGVIPSGYCEIARTNKRIAQRHVKATM